MRIICVVYSLGSGGAERVISRLASYWAQQGHDVAMLTMDPSIPDFYSIDARVERISLPLAAKSTSTWQAIRNSLVRVKTLRKLIKQKRPDVVVAFLDTANLITVLASTGTGARAVISERFNPQSDSVSTLLRLLYVLIYRCAYKLILQTTSVEQWFKSWGFRNTLVIANPVDVKLPSDDSPRAIRCRYGLNDDVVVVVAVGRLVRQKGFDLLLEAFSNAKKSASTPVHLLIAGEGPERDALTRQINDLNLNSCVSLVGKISPIEEFLVSADVFVLSSRFEGFPNVLVEAMACGRAVIAFDCSFGPRDIIHPDHDGILVPDGDVDALGKSIAYLIANPDIRREYGERAKVARTRFELGKIASQWLTAIAS